MENHWPPVTECVQFRSGLIQEYLIKQEWEDMKDIDDSEIFDPSEQYPCRVEVARRFLHQVRTSRGYDVDCEPPRSFESPFEVMEVDPVPKDYSKDVEKDIELAINDIHGKTGKKYEFLKLLKLVLALPARCDLLTFTAREIGTADVETFIAMVFQSVGVEGKVLECRLKPEGDAPWC